MLKKSYPIPSTVMINSYNAKIKEKLPDAPFELQSWTVADDEQVGIIDVTAIDTTERERQGSAKRFNLQDLIPATEGEFAIVNTDEVFNLVETKYEGGIDEVVELLHAATELNYVSEVTRDFDVERTLVGLWVTRQLYIPITDVILNYLDADAYVLNYIEREGSNLYEAYELIAKPNSIGYIGSAKIIVAASEDVVIEEPAESSQQIDLGQITNNDTPGEWRTVVTSYDEKDAEYDNIIASVLVAVNKGFTHNVTLDDLNVYGDSSGNIYMSPISDDDDDSKVTGILRITIEVVLPEEPELNLSNVTNCDEPGTWHHVVADMGSVDLIDAAIDALEQASEMSMPELLPEDFEMESDDIDTVIITIGAGHPTPAYATGTLTVKVATSFP